MKPPLDPNACSIDAFVQRSAATVKSGSVVLDAGAGDSPYRHYFEHAHYVAVDFAATAYHEFRNLDAICRLEQLPFADESFDAVLCSEVLEHVPQPSMVLSELRRVLKPGGRLFMTTPQSWEVHEAPYDYFRYTSFGLGALMSQAGLTVEVIEARGGFFTMLAQRMRHVPLYLTTVPVLRSKLGRRAMRIVFMRFLVRLLVSVDPLDTKRIDTIGYACVAVRPAAATH